MLVIIMILAVAHVVATTATFAWFRWDAPGHNTIMHDFKTANLWPAHLIVYIGVFLFATLVDMSGISEDA